MKISFNLRLRYEEAEDYIDKMREIWGEAYFVANGSYYKGTKTQIDDLLIYIWEKKVTIWGVWLLMKARRKLRKDVFWRWRKMVLLNKERSNR